MNKKQYFFCLENTTDLKQFCDSTSNDTTGSKGTTIWPSDDDSQSKFFLRNLLVLDNSEEGRKRTRGVLQLLFTHIKIKAGFSGRHYPRCSHILLRLVQKQVCIQKRVVQQLFCSSIHCRKLLKSQDAVAANSLSCLFIVEETHSSKFCVGFSMTRELIIVTAPQN